MPVYIHQQDALQRMAAVEGSRWLQYQETHRRSAYGFYAWLDAWHAKQGSGSEYLDEPVREFLEAPGDGTIYGEGGYARYAVRTDGELVLLGSTTRDERRLIALEQGFCVL